MSYSSENVLAPDARIRDVREFVKLLGFEKTGLLKSEEYGRFEEYMWFDDKDYRSWTGVELSIHINGDKKVVVSTRTRICRSYFDLTHQNYTISSLQKRFGGKFTTDEGSGRYLKPMTGPPPAAASGCYIAFSHFGHNLIKAAIYHKERDFPNHPPIKGKDMAFLLGLNPRVLANNLIVPFLVACMEDYFKSTFIALLRYSLRKEAFLKNIRLQGEQLLIISDGKATVEEQIAEGMSFQNIPTICRHFTELDQKLDIGGALRKPYHRRSQTLYESLSDLVYSRHDFIHRATLDLSMTDERISALIEDLDASITRVYKRITEHYGWFFDKGWALGRMTRKNI